MFKDQIDRINLAWIRLALLWFYPSPIKLNVNTQSILKPNFPCPSVDRFSQTTTFDVEIFNILNISVSICAEFFVTDFPNTHFDF